MQEKGENQASLPPHFVFAKIEVERKNNGNILLYFMFVHLDKHI